MLSRTWLVALRTGLSDDARWLFAALLVNRLQRSDLALGGGEIVC